MTKAVAKRVPTPKPVVVEEVCSLCNEDWDLHPENATAADCIEILRAKKVKHDCCHHIHWTYTYPYTSTWTINPPVQVTPTAPHWYSPNIAGTADSTTTLQLVS